MKPMHHNHLIGTFGLVLAVLAWCVAASDARAAGLLAPNDRSLPPLRITEHSVEAAIHDQIALTTVQQTFRNDTGQRLEATYVFPLPENAELTNFQMSFNGQMVEGEVLPADKARQIYESIVRQTKDPGLIEFIGRRLLQMRVFPIEPNSDTRIQVKYQQICKPISGMHGYHYPLRTSKTAGQVHGTVRFNIELDTTSPLKNVWSPTHTVEIVRQGEHAAKIAYEASKGSLEEDFTLLFATDSSDLGMSVIAYKPRETRPGYFVLTLAPKQLWPETENQPQDVVFVIDTSGSMAGEKMQQARSALKYCVDQLNERDRFSIVRFSTGVDVLFDDLMNADRENRERAREWIDRFHAAGGTNITDALSAALDLRPGNRPPKPIRFMEHGDVREEGDVEPEAAQPEQAREGAMKFEARVASRPFVVAFITDGQGNQPAQETLDMVKRRRAAEGARIFSFGVGNDVNTIFLDQLATNYSGKPTYVQPGESLELVLGDFFSVISQPVLTDLRLTLPEIGVTERFPAKLGDLYHGQQLIVAGRFDEPRTGRVRLTAIRNGEEIEYTWKDVSFTHTAEAQYVPPIWAGRKISYLIDQIRAHGESREMVSEVVALSQEFGIQTPYTSWLVNPEQEQLVRTRRYQEGGNFYGQPGGSTFGGGGGGGLRGGPASAPGRPAEPATQRGALGAAGVPADALNAPVNGDDLEELALPWQAVGQAAGESATALARKNAELRDASSKDVAGTLDETRILSRKIGERWYNRIGRFLVDEAFNEKSKVTVVKFGSNAYFEVVQRRPDLRQALAASQNIVVMLNDTQAIVVAEKSGIEDFSPEQLEHSGLVVR